MKTQLLYLAKCLTSIYIILCLENKSNNKILNSEGNVQRCKVDRTDKIDKCTVRLAEYCHTPDLVQAFSEENGGINQVLRPAKPATYMTTSVSNSEKGYCKIRFLKFEEKRIHSLCEKRIVIKKNKNCNTEIYRLRICIKS